jgi:hypothetical protein
MGTFRTKFLYLSGKGEGGCPFKRLVSYQTKSLGHPDSLFFSWPRVNFAYCNTKLFSHRHLCQLFYLLTCSCDLYWACSKMCAQLHVMMHIPVGICIGFPRESTLLSLLWEITALNINSSATPFSPGWAYWLWANQLVKTLQSVTLPHPFSLLYFLLQKEIFKTNLRYHINLFI